MSSNMRKDVEDLWRRVKRVEDANSQNRQWAEAMERKFSALDGDLSFLVDELRQFTGEVKRLSLMTESRNRVHLLESRVEAAYGDHARVRKGAALWLRAAGTAAWPAARDESGAVMHKLAETYWLASANLAFAAWADDDRLEAKRRAMAALLADPVNASLYFGLVMRRHGRDESAAEWLRCCFAAVKPAMLDHVFGRLFLAVCDNAFDSAAVRGLASAAKAWRNAELASHEPEALDLTVWRRVLRSHAAAPDTTIFPLLRQYCPQWQEVEKSLEWLALWNGLAGFYDSLADDAAWEGEAPVQYGSPSPDLILDELVARQLADELPLRRDLRLSWLVVEENGDLEAAAEKMRTDGWEERGTLSFATWLAALLEAGTAAIPARTLRFTYGLAVPWLEMACERERREAESDLPATLRLEIGSWSGTTGGGENASDLLAAHSRHLDETSDEKAPPQWLDETLVLPAGLLLLIVFVTLDTIIVPALALGGFGYYFFTRVQAAEREKERRRNAREEKRREDIALLSGCLEEVKMLRQKLAAGDRSIDAARERVRGIDPGKLWRPGVPHLGEDRPYSAGGAFPPWAIEPEAQASTA